MNKILNDHLSRGNRRGALTVLASVIISGTAVDAIVCQWLGDQEVPPREAMKHVLGQTKAASPASAAGISVTRPQVSACDQVFPGIAER